MVRAEQSSAAPHAIDHWTRVLHHLRRYFQRGSLLRDAADAGVDAAGVFTHDHEVNVRGSLVFERGFHVGIQLHRPQVDVLIKREARLEQDAHFQNAGLDVRVADGAQEDGVELLEFLQRTVGKDLAGTLVALGVVSRGFEVTVRSINARGRNGPAPAMARRIPALATPSGRR